MTRVEYDLGKEKQQLMHTMIFICSDADSADAFA